MNEQVSDRRGRRGEREKRKKRISFAAPWRSSVGDIGRKWPLALLPDLRDRLSFAGQQREQSRWKMMAKGEEGVEKIIWKRKKEKCWKVGKNHENWWKTWNLTICKKKQKTPNLRKFTQSKLNYRIYERIKMQMFHWLTDVIITLLTENFKMQRISDITTIRFNENLRLSPSYAILSLQWKVTKSISNKKIAKFFPFLIEISMHWSPDSSIHRYLSSEIILYPVEGHRYFNR